MSHHIFFPLFFILILFQTSRLHLKNDQQHYHKLLLVNAQQQQPQQQVPNNQTNSDLHHLNANHQYNLMKQNVPHSQLKQVPTNSHTSTPSQPQNLISRLPPLVKQTPFSFMANRQKEQPNYKTTTACEGNQMELSCEDGKLIHLVRANYGRFSLTICNEFGYSNYSVQCASFRSFLFMETRCNNLTTCNVTVSKDLFGDPCEGTAKYLEVQYHCNDVNSQNNNNRMPSASSNPLISTNSIARPQQMAAPTNSHKSQPTTSDSSSGLVGGQTASTTSSEGNYSYNNNAVSQDQTKTTSGNDLANLAAQQQQPAASVIQQQQQFCSPQTSSRNLYWNFTRAGHVARQPCPEGSSGHSVSWICDLERLRFMPAISPDFSQCRSNWLTRLSQQLDQMLEMPSSSSSRQSSVSLSSRQQDEEMIKSILGELNLLAKTKELFSEDLKRIDIMISQMIAQLKTFSVLAGSASQASTMPWQKPRQQLSSLNPLVSIYRELFAELTSICSSLFDSFQRNAWLELPSNEARRHLETRLLGHLKESGLLLAQSLSVDQLADMQPIRQPNVQAGISVIINNQLKSAIVSSMAANAVDSPDGTTNELNLFGRLFDNNNNNNSPSSSASAQEDGGQAEFRLQSQLLNELAANGMTKFLIVDVKKPDYLLIRTQLGQQVALEQQQLPTSSIPLDFGQNLAGDHVQARIFGVFAINGDTGELFGVAPAQQQVDSTLNINSNNNRQQLDSIRLQRLGELMAQWPINVEFKLAQQATGTGQPQPLRHCLSLTSDMQAGGGGQQQADPMQPNTANRCHLSRYNATNFVCSCDRFGFVALTQSVISSANSNLNTQFSIQNDQWPVPTSSNVNFDFASQGNQMTTQQLADSRTLGGDQSFVVNKPQAQLPGLLTYIFVMLGVGLLILSLVGLIINVVLRLTRHSSRLSKKQKSFFQNFRNGPATGPLTANHNLMGSDPLVSGAATTQSASIIGLANGANTLAHHQICNGSTSSSSNNYKTHQQLYAAHLNHLGEAPPMMETYSKSGSSARWPIRLLVWLVERPAGWLSNLTSSPSSAAANDKADRNGMIQHRVIGSGQGTNSTLGTLVCQKSQYSGHQNGYTTSLGLHQPLHQQHQTIARAHLGSSGSGQSAVPLNPGASSSSSYVSSSAYYEEIGPGNLTKVNPSQHHVSQQQQHHTMVDPFLMKHQQQQQQRYFQEAHQHSPSANGHQWQPSNNSATISYSAGSVAPGQQQHQATTFGNANNQKQQMSLITKQHLLNDLSPLQSSAASSSAGSQHSAGGHLQQANGANGITTPRHYLFASPVAVNAYKQQQFRGNQQQQ